MHLAGWIIKHQLLLWTRDIRWSVWRSHDSTWSSSHRKERGSYLMTGQTAGGKTLSPIPRAILAGLIAGIMAGYVSSIFAGTLGFVIGFIAGAIVGSRTVLLMHKAREQDQ